jgi:hypothetical protein
MNSWSALNRFLQTDPRDAGCGQAMELLRSTRHHLRNDLARRPYASMGGIQHRYRYLAHGPGRIVQRA